MATAGSSIRYRADIDGLRAVAIVAVVAYHAGIPGFGAGYLGVDVFFVISGFLITRLLWSEQLATGTIAMRAFYARRARRLLPAMAAVLVAVTAAGLLLMSPGFELRSLGSQMFSASVFASNIQFWRMGGYFSAPALTLPLLHTWTLAVEEQFYLVWPGILLLLGRLIPNPERRTRRAIAVLATLTLLSWAAAFFIPTRHEYMAFYLSPFRGWEFGVGALVAFLPKSSSGPKGLVQSAALLVLLTCLFLNREFSSAGLVAVATVGATAALIAGGDSAGPATKLLSLRPVVAIGLVSYGWYLWHWPALSFVRIVTVTGVEPLRDSLICLGALALAVLTWFFIERPIRRLEMPAFSTTQRSLRSGAVIVLAGLAMAAILFGVGSLPSKPGSIAEQVEEARPYWKTPEYQCSDEATERQNCTFGPSQAKDAILLTGDSHAAMIRSGLAHLADVKGDYRLVSRTLSSCRPVLQTSPAAADPCQRQNEGIAAETPELVRGGLKGVILGAYWGSPGFGHMDDLASQVRAWRRAGVRVALVAESPVFSHSPRHCLLHQPPSYCGLTRAAFEEQRATVMRELHEAVGGDPNVRVFDLSAPYCDEARCNVIVGGRLYFYDTHHLSLGGGLAISSDLEAMTDWLLDDPS